MISSLKRIGAFVSRTLPWVNLAAFVALASAGLVGAMIVVGIFFIQRH